ncbi:hypothetical protein ORI20_32380 [Mycobacterium sp. CVI_P3]|uniref:DUF2516 domain-containing protein n=1 Tax=Mycobacterium pinniadriaticum TaxID=2994102 RepID=A0ABT3SPU8_9MYCO|nr:hypothetical protein [Mycobacterium pinniadriaticum]MCX2934960.1 hypothetical protein [Mycobacterium pinniadriaticum]MCX2941382.1 hypothetical protein [Mycobacterium pinniadriaticum]
MITLSATEVLMPAWSGVLLVVGSVLILGGWVATVVAREPHWDRRFYWFAWVIGGAVGSASLIPRGLGLALAAYAALIFVAIVWAFFRTNYIKFGDRIIAATPTDRRPDSEQ